MTIQLKDARWIDGVLQAAGALVSTKPDLERELVSQNLAIFSGKQYLDLGPNSNFSGLSGVSNSTHLVGLWPLNTQSLYTARDISGNRNHWLANGFAGNSLAGFSGASGWAKHTGALSMGKINAHPTDQRFDIGGPGQSFIVCWETRKLVAPTTQAHCLVGKGTSAPPAGALGLWLGMRDNGAAFRGRCAINNGSPDAYTSDIPWVAGGPVYHVAFVRDANDNGGRIKAYINGVLDTGFNGGAGFVAFAPTAQHHTHALSLLGVSANTDSTNGPTTNSPNDFEFRNLQIYVTPPSIFLPSNMAELMAKLAANPGRALTSDELS